MTSLALGIRAKAGAATREFTPNGDPRGRPIAWEQFGDPVSVKAQRAVVPRLRGEHSLEDLAQLALLPFASRELVVAFVRAARLYQDAAWLADSEPNLAWLLLVSAIEAAAGFWRSAEDDPVDRLRQSRPELEALLKESGGDPLVARVAPLIAPYMGANKRFVDFLVTFLPDPPAIRPPEWAQFAWADLSSSKKAFTRVYGYRSRALHTGVPFPTPMCEPPFSVGDDSVPIEVPVGMATSAMGAQWNHKDTPLLLCTFEHIARGALLKWWHYSVGRFQDNPTNGAPEIS
jgi:hypothetical protein